jgi:hypothetical protein
MRMRFAVLTLLLAVSARPAEAQFNTSDPAPGENFNVELGLMFWTPTPELTVQTGALAVIGDTQVDFVREFGIEDKRFNEFRFVGKAGRKHKIRFNYIEIDYAAEATLARTITFGNRTFTVGLPATADIQWKMYKIGYEYDIVARDRGFFGIIGELKHNEIAANLSSPIGAEAANAKAPVPTFGVIGRGYPHKNVSITAEFTGFKVPDSLSEEFEASLYDFDIYGTVSFGRHLGAQVGYRSLTAEYLVDEDAGNFKLKGPYFGGVLRF